MIAGVLLAHLLLVDRLVAGVRGAASTPPRRIDVSLVRQLAPSAPPVAGAGMAAVVVRPEHAVRPSTRAESLADERAAAKAAAREGAASAASVGSAASVASVASAVSAAAAEAAEAAEAAREALLAESEAKEKAEAETTAASSAETSSAAATSSASASESRSASALASASSAAASGVLPATAAAAPPGPPFHWPPSTRLTYTLTGRYRNRPIFGHAAVDWRREGAHYQVEFVIHVPPLFEQRLSSDGEITGDGLRPRQYDESFKVPFIAPRVRRVAFAETVVTLNNGNQVSRLPQTQDSASQFVQFVWMFATHPEWLRPGAVIDMPLALPGNLRRWHYQVGELETLALKFGPLGAVHLKPLLDGPRKSNEYPFEIWTAPTLQYLPVRIHVMVDDHNYADLSVDSLPMQAASDDDPPPAARTPR